MAMNTGMVVIALTLHGLSIFIQNIPVEPVHFKKNQSIIFESISPPILNQLRIFFTNKSEMCL
jgi:hypothetical protein